MINYLGASASLLLTGRSVEEWGAPLVFAGLALGSWALRPASRKMMASGADVRVGPMAWGVPVLILGAMVAVAFATLPAGAPPR